MNTSSWRWSSFALALAVALVAPGSRTAEAAPPAGAAPRVVEITAKRFEFSPKEITLEKGQPVTLRLTSLDVTHGYFNRELKLDLDIESGKTTEVTFTPSAAGKYRVICDHFCGSGHGNMNMTVVVQEPPARQAAP
jgi:cytochrome c oxidase subunit II